MARRDRGSRKEGPFEEDTAAQIKKENTKPTRTKKKRGANKGALRDEGSIETSLKEGKMDTR